MAFEGFYVKDAAEQVKQGLEGLGLGIAKGGIAIGRGLSDIGLGLSSRHQGDQRNEFVRLRATEKPDSS